MGFDRLPVVKAEESSSGKFMGRQDKDLSVLVGTCRIHDIGRLSRASLASRRMCEVGRTGQQGSIGTIKSKGRNCLPRIGSRGRKKNVFGPSSAVGAGSDEMPVARPAVMPLGRHAGMVAPSPAHMAPHAMCLSRPAWMRHPQWMPLPTASDALVTAPERVRPRKHTPAVRLRCRGRCVLTRMGYRRAPAQ